MSHVIYHGDVATKKKERKKEKKRKKKKLKENKEDSLRMSDIVRHRKC